MSYLNVIYLNHLDLTWRRPRYTADKSGDYLIAPYAEVQERQLDRAIEYMRDGGVYTLEQTISLREYLERNPDAEPEIRQFISDGRLRILGGGESVTDTNLADGENLIRNHLYSRLWLKEKYGCAPRLGAIPDSFGLSAGLPGLMRQLGYPGLLQFSRVFGGCKTYWRGVNGDIVALRSADGIPNVINWYGNFRKSRVCTVCGGRGCTACHMRGTETIESPESSQSILDREAQLREMSKNGDVTLLMDGEEARAPEGAMKALKTLAERCGMELRFICPEDHALKRFKEVLERVDNPDENDIDPRPEGNPMASGCYTTRIRLKQENRRCESALRTAEHLAALASLKGLNYPAKTLEYWWRKLSFVNFHDALPASHSDGAYNELMEICRSLRNAAYRITERSAKKLLEDLNLPEAEGETVAILNPLEIDAENVVLKAGVQVPKDITGGKVIGPDGKECPVLSVVKDKAADIEAAEVTFIGSVPALGYALYRFIPEDAEPAAETLMPHGGVLENEYLRVEFTPYSIKQIVDKATGKVIAGEGTFSPVLSDDAGHPWGRTNPVQYVQRADLDDHWENMFPPDRFTRTLTLEHRDNYDIARLRLIYSRPERHVELLRWTAEFLLAKGSRELQVKLNVTYDAKDMRLSTDIVLPAAPADGKLDYEIPLGQLARGPVEELNGQLGWADEWPALRYVTAKLPEFAVTLCNNGTAGHSVGGNRIRVSLLRVPTQLGCGWGSAGAIDPEPHEFRFTLAACSNKVQQTAYRRGMLLNTEFPAISLKSSVLSGNGSVSASTGKFAELPNDLPLLAFKGAENGHGLILRYLGGAESETLHFSKAVRPCRLLEDAAEDAANDFTFTPYQLRTFLAENGI